MPKQSELIEVMDFLIKKFQVERVIYVCLSLSAVGLLAYLLYDMLTSSAEIDYQAVFALFGPAGIIGVTLTRILKMWNDCIELTKISMIKKLKEEDE